MPLRASTLSIFLLQLVFTPQAFALDVPSFSQATASDLRKLVPQMVPLIVTKESTKERIALRSVVLAGVPYIVFFSSTDELAKYSTSVQPTDQMIYMDRGALCDGLRPDTRLVLNIGSERSLVTNGAFYCATFAADHERIKKLNAQTKP